ncbi:MAG TPA: helix-turn-helix domain-containing protein [Rubrivivax sp.]|nr:helix-turn-helix domain-containing protein [Rubrivivax sp.]HRY87999.1 helix-turn-helix domain-containing protein [Rubrivivax sp.]
MHPADINAALRKAGSSQAAVARSLAADGRPVSHGAVHLVVSGRGTSARIARRISEITGTPVSRLWPHRYLDLQAEQAAAREAARIAIAGRKAAQPGNPAKRP